MQECCCVNSFTPHFTFVKELERRLQPRQLLGLTLGNREGRVDVWIEWQSQEDINYQIQ